MKKYFFVAHPIAIPAPIDYDITRICMDINYTKGKKENCKCTNTRSCTARTPPPTCKHHFSFVPFILHYMG